MRAWFISDIHLRNINERNSVLLLRFLRSLIADPQTTHLYLLGDIFDLWVGDSNLFQSKFQSLVDAIAELKRKGVEVVYFEGNHDVHVKGFWERKFSIPVYVDARYEKLGRFLVRLEHGDLMNPEDVAYLRYRHLIRRPWAEKLAYILPGRLLDGAGIRASKKSRKRSMSDRQRSEEDLRQMIRNYAKDKWTEENFDYIITGHMHVRDEFTFEADGKTHTSINLGSWFEEPMALCLEDQGHRWEKI